MEQAMAKPKANDFASPTADPSPSSLEEASTIAEAIQSILEEFDVQPVLFIGAGIARRYINAPDWEGALRYALDQVGGAAQSYSYFVQKFGDDKIAIGTAIADLVFEWAWTDGRKRFAEKLFDGAERHVFSAPRLHPRTAAYSSTSRIPYGGMGARLPMSDIL